MADANGSNVRVLTHESDFSIQDMCPLVLADVPDQVVFMRSLQSGMHAYIAVLNTTSSEGHKFKLTALFLNRQSGKAFFGGWIFRKAMDGKEKDMGKGDGWGASFRKVAGDRGGSRRKSRAASRGARAPSLLQRRAKRKGKEPKLKVA